MNWKLIFQLSLFGLAMAIATVYVIPSAIEPILWVVIFVISAVIIAKRCTSKYFLHGFLVSVMNSIWITATHVILFQAYVNHHDAELQMMSNMPITDSPRLMMLLSGPIIGVISGLVLGLFAFVASRLLKKSPEHDREHDNMTNLYN